eukprot:472539-Rhodomonas_salina.1
MPVPGLLLSSGKASPRISTTRFVSLPPVLRRVNASSSSICDAFWGIWGFAKSRGNAYCTTCQHHVPASLCENTKRTDMVSGPIGPIGGIFKTYRRDIVGLSTGYRGPIGGVSGAYRRGRGKPGEEASL